MTYAVLLLLGTAPAQDAVERFIGRLTFEEARPEGEPGERVVAILRNPEHWRAAFRAIEARLGPMPEAMAVAVSFDYDGDEVAKAAVREGNARIRFNLKKLEALQRKIDDLEQQRRKLAREGKRMVFKVPPARIDRVLWHELVHVFHGDLEAPAWFTEGLAQWFSEDMNCLRAFAHERRPVEAVDLPTDGKTDPYARGHLFWSWIAARGATKAAVRGALVDRAGWKTSIEKAAGLGWDAVVAAEREWSVKEVERLRAAAP